MYPKVAEEIRSDRWELLFHTECILSICFTGLYLLIEIKQQQPPPMIMTIHYDD